MASLEKVLINSEEQIRALFDSILIPTYVWQKVGDFFQLIDYNKATYDYSQGAVEKYLGMKASEIYRERLDVLKNLNYSFNRKTTFTLEAKYYFNVFKEERDLIVKYVYLPPDLVLVHTEDITERRRAEQKLKESERKFRSLVETTSDWIWEVDKNGVYTYSSPKIRDLLGYEPEEVIGKTPFNLMPSDEAKHISVKFNDIILSQKSFEGLENKNLHKNGRVITLETSGMPIFDNEGKFQGYRGIDRDITKRKQAEQKLKESEEKYRSLFNNMNAGFAYHEVIVDENNKPINYKYIEANPAFEKLTGLKARDIIGKKVTEILPGTEDDPADWIGKFGNVGLTGIPLTIEDYSEAIDRWYKVSGYSPKKGFFAVTFTDITEIKKAEQKLMESEEKFRAIFEAIPDLYFLVSKDTTVLDYRGKKQKLYAAPKEFLGKKVVEVVPPHLGAQTVELVNKTIRTRQPQVLEYELQMKDKVHFYEARYFYLSKDRVTIFVRDISDRKMIENQVINLAKFPSENPNPVLRITKENVIYINKSGQTLLNLTESSAIPNIFKGQVIDAFDDNAVKTLEANIYGQIYSFNIVPIKQEGYANIYGQDITERVKSENALNIEKKFTEDIFNSTGDTIFVFEPETGKGHRWNEVFNEVSGYSDEEISSMKAPDSFYSEEDLKKASVASKIILNEGKTTVEMSLITKDGKKIPYEYTGTSFKSSDGKNLIVSVGRDMTERNEAEEKLKESEKNYRELYEWAPNAYFSIRQDKTLIKCNIAAEILLGYNKEELYKMKVFDLYANTESGLEKAQELFKQFLAGENIQDQELQMKKKSGENIWISLTVIPILDQAGNVIESRSMVLDINERKLAQEKLENSYEQLREMEYIINNSPGVVFLWQNSEGWPVEFVSENVIQFGYTPEEFYSGKVIYNDIIHPDDVGRVSEEVNNHTNEGDNDFVQEYRIITKSGKIRWFDDRTWVRRDSESNITHFQGIVLDITDRKTTEEALKLSEKKYQEAFERASFYKDIFAHDINNILQVITSSAELISYHLDDSEKLKDIDNIANIIRRQVQRGAKLVRNVRTLSQLDDSESLLEPIEGMSVLKNSIKFIQSAYSERNVEVKVDTFANMFSVRANELLQEIFDNILINAIKYNENSPVDIQIKITKKKSENENYIKMEFLDNGIGVQDNKKKVLFKEGYRHLKRSKGMGVGLSLISKILKSYNGKILVEDKVKGDYEKGSNFIVLLPEAN